MNKLELMDAFLAIAREKRGACNELLESLPKESYNERKALSIQRNLYQLGIPFVNWATRCEGIHPVYARRLDSLLAGDGTLREIYAAAPEEEKVELAIYLHTMLFFRQNFLRRYKEEAATVTDPRDKFEADLKVATVEDLMKAYRECFESMGGRKGLVI